MTTCQYCNGSGQTTFIADPINQSCPPGTPTYPCGSSNVSEITFDPSPSQCESSLGITQNSPLATVLSLISNAICVLKTGLASLTNLFNAFVTATNNSISSINTSITNLNTVVNKLTLSWTALTTFYDSTYSAQDAAGYHAGYFSSVDASGNVRFQGVVQVTLGSTLTTTPLVIGLPSAIFPSALILKSTTVITNGTGAQNPGWLQITTGGIINLVTPAANVTAIVVFDFTYNVH